MPVLSKEVMPLSPWGKAAAGAVAAMIANTLVYPLDIVKTRLQVQTSEPSLDEDPDNYYNGTLDAIVKIYKKDGIMGLYSGLPSSLVGVASQNFAYFYWYGLIRDAYIRRTGRRNFSTATELILGAIAGALGQIFTIPVSVITTKQQTNTKPISFVGTAKEVIEDDGITGLWRGLKASLVLVVNPSITYGSFERLKAILYPGKTVLMPGQNFLLGALSKAMATIATQPMIVAKVMQQSSDKKRRQYKSFVDALAYLYKNEGIPGLFKGIGPQISKGVLVQGLLFMFKDQVELFVILLLRLVQARLKRGLLVAA